MIPVIVLIKQSGIRSRFSDCVDFQKQPPEVFCKKSVLINFAKFTGKHLCQSIFFNKVSALRPATLLKRRPWHRCFPVNFAKFLRTPIFIEHLWWLLLDFATISGISQDNQVN